MNKYQYKNTNEYEYIIMTQIPCNDLHTYLLRGASVGRSRGFRAGPAPAAAGSSQGDAALNANPFLVDLIQY
jgi:hypothetical protein